MSFTSSRSTGSLIAAVFIGALGPSAAFAQSQDTLTMAAINSASIEDVATVPLDQLQSEQTTPDPAVIRLQVLLDRAGASPGVIDGYDGENVRKAISSIEALWGLSVDGVADDELLGRLASEAQVASRYTISEDDLDKVTGPVSEDYSELAEMELVGYASAAEAIAEKFHMDQDLLELLNPAAQFAAGETIVVVDPGAPLTDIDVARIEADKSQRRVRAYDADGQLIAAYPATIGSQSNPSPSGTHTVTAIAPEPNYTYDPETFQQGDNTERLIIPPGPNNPVGSTWIDLSEPGYGIHGTPEPALIDKTASHGCVRLTNWDAAELASLVSQGVQVVFVD